jgi:O-acetyl-ADP-ribose deacetylase (regulator of RNase III)
MPASLTFTTGDLLTADVDALVNAVNCEGVMGKGIALQFKQAWPAMFVEYQRLTRAGHVQPGAMQVHHTGSMLGRQNPVVAAPMYGGHQLQAVLRGHRMGAASLSKPRSPKAA